MKPSDHVMLTINADFVQFTREIDITQDMYDAIERAMGLPRGMIFGYVTPPPAPTPRTRTVKLS